MRKWKIAAMVVGILVLFLAFRLYLLGKESRTKGVTVIGLMDGRLQPCPDKPNCVSSQTDSSDTLHYIPPLDLSKKILLDRLQGISGCHIIEQSDIYLWAECRTRLFGFVDDLEFYLPPDQPNLIHVRSASRVGRSDLKANRKRVERLRSQP